MLNKQTAEGIEEKTRRILEDVLGDIDRIEPPINLARILRHYDLKLIEADFGNNTVSGAFNKSTKVIFIAKNDSKYRQAFTIAHELGHMILHDKKADVFYRHQANIFNHEDKDAESQANRFAASLLMPSELVEKFCKKNKDADLLAAYFGVSRQAADLRLKELNIH